MGLAYWTWFLFIFVFNSIPITKLFFSTSNLGFCKAGPHHSHNQTLKVIPCSKPCILTLRLFIFVFNSLTITKYYHTLKHPSLCAYICSQTHIWVNIKKSLLSKFEKLNNTIIHALMFNHRWDPQFSWGFASSIIGSLLH